MSGHAMLQSTIVKSASVCSHEHATIFKKTSTKGTDFVNTKFPIPVTVAKLESFIEYFRECGYTVEERDQGEHHWAWYSNDAPGYGELTPIAEKCLDGDRFGRVVYIRLPSRRKAD